MAPPTEQPRVGIVLVSHSRPLALAVKALVEAMAPDLPLAVAAGTGPDRSELGTDAMEILEAIQSVSMGAGVLVLMDMGSAVLSAETALGFLDDEIKAKVRLCAAPFVEGAVAAGVVSHIGGDLEAVEREALGALSQKSSHLAPDSTASTFTPSAAPQAEVETEIVLPVRNPHGLHARPAAKLVQAAARFRAEIRVFNATTGKGPASARSLSGIGALEILQGQQIRLAASGPESEAALQALGALIASGFGEAEEPASSSSNDPAPVSTNGLLPVSDGIALGPLFLFSAGEPVIPDTPAENRSAELQKLREAVAAACIDLDTERKEPGIGGVSDDRAAIFEAQRILLDDPALWEAADRAVTEDHANAAAAWRQSTEKLRRQYEGLSDDYLRRRGADVSDVGRRVLAKLGIETAAPPIPAHPSILVCDDLTPSEAVRLRDTAVAGVICLAGGRTSHGAILLRNLGIPALAQARARVSELREGVPAALDGTTGELWIDPAPELRAELESRRDLSRVARIRELEEALRPAVTRDGHRVEIAANVGGVDDARNARHSGAEGIGLLRTEFLFLDRASAPNEEEQYQALRAIFDAFGPGPLVVRTLDAGGDKNLPYLGMPKEANPFLGVRALRISLRHPELFQTQLRALLRAGDGRELRIMFPMVADVEELDRAIVAVETAHRSLVAEGRAHLWPVPTGIMIEIPSAALLADALARRADFFSIGTNDLTQYTLAADRGNPALGAYHEPFHPAVLELIARIVEAAHRHGKPVAVCGEAAADPVAARLLIGLGIDELSVASRAIPRIKAIVRASRLADLHVQALAARQASTIVAVRAALEPPPGD